MFESLDTDKVYTLARIFVMMACSLYYDSTLFVYLSLDSHHGSYPLQGVPSGAVCTKWTNSPAHPVFS